MGEQVREAVLGEVMQDAGEAMPDQGWFILGVDGYFDVDNALWCEFSDYDAPWTSEYFDLRGTLPEILALATRPSQDAAGDAGSAT